MSIETRLRNTGDKPGGGGGGSSNTGGLASTGGAYVTYIADASLSNERILTAGANISLTTDATTITIAANTGSGANSAGLLGTGGYFLLGSGNASMPNSKVFTARSAILISTDATSFFISATSDIPLARVGTSRFFRLQEYANLGISAGRIAGGLISTSATTFSVTSGNGFIKATDSDTDTVLFFDWSALGVTGTTTNSVRFVGVEYNAGAPQVVQRTTNIWDYDTAFPIGTVVNDSGSVYVINNPWATSDAMTNVIERFDSMSFIARDNRVGGLILSDSGTRRLIVSAGTILSRLSEFGISAINTTVAGSGTFDSYYRNGSGGWTRVAGQAQWDSSNYDDGSGTLAAIPVLQYSSKWFYVMADSSVAMLYGQDTDAAPAIIFDEAPPSSVPDRILYQGMLIGRFVFQVGATAPTRTETAFGTAFTSSQVEDHGELSGLSDNDHPQYFLAASTTVFANTGAFYLTHTSANGLLINSKRISAGSSVTTHTDATTFYINATTSVGSSVVYAPTGGFYLAFNSDATLTAEKILMAGSSISVHSDATFFYINALTGGGAGSVYAPTGGNYITFLADAALTNEKILTAGSNITISTNGTTITINATTGGGAAGNPNGFFPLLPQQAKLYANNSAARIDGGTGVWRLIYDAATQQYGVFQFVCPQEYSSNPYLRILWGIDSGMAVARSVNWIVDQWGFSPFSTSLSYYPESYGALNSSAVALSAAYSAGNLQMMTVPLINTISLGAGNLIKIRLSASGAYVGDAEIVGIGFEYTRA